MELHPYKYWEAHIMFKRARVLCTVPLALGLFLIPSPAAAEETPISATSDTNVALLNMGEVAGGPAAGSEASTVNNEMPLDDYGRPLPTSFPKDQIETFLKEHSKLDSGTVAPLINRVDCGDRTDFLQFNGPFFAWKVCFANSGTQFGGVLDAVTYHSGNNTGVFYYSTNDLCIAEPFGKWQPTEVIPGASDVRPVDVCVITIA